jgi:hypothetical protein
MKKMTFLSCICFQVCAHAQLSRHVVLISIDGFHSDMYEDNTWPAPNLRELMKAIAITNENRAFVKFLMRHWHSLARKIWLEDAKEMAQFARSIHLLIK